MENSEDVEPKPVAQESAEQPKADDKVVKRIKFHYIKSNFFRVVHVDGVFSERRPIPLQMVQEVSAEGELGEPILGETIVRDGVVREIEANLVFNMEIAEATIKWLQDKVTQLRKIQESQAGKQSDATAEESK
jgi:hypothetical protein